MIRTRCAHCGEIGASHTVNIRIMHEGKNILPFNDTLRVFLCPKCAPCFEPEYRTPLFPTTDGTWPLLTAVANVQEIHGWNVDEKEGE